MEFERFQFDGLALGDSSEKVISVQGHPDLSREVGSQRWLEFFSGRVVKLEGDHVVGLTRVSRITWPEGALAPGASLQHILSQLGEPSHRYKTARSEVLRYDSREHSMDLAMAGNRLLYIAVEPKALATPMHSTRCPEHEILYASAKKDLADFSLLNCDGLHLGNSRAQVLQVLGQPEHIQSCHDDGFVALRFARGTEVYLLDERVSRLVGLAQVTGPGLQLRKGASRAQLLETLGGPDLVRSPESDGEGPLPFELLAYMRGGRWLECTLAHGLLAAVSVGEDSRS